MTHFVSATTHGTTCLHCGEHATHKVGEEIAFDDPHQIRHNLTAYVCCQLFSYIMGMMTSCPVTEVTREKQQPYISDGGATVIGITEELPRGGCQQFVSEVGMTRSVSCCDSCHDDEDHGYGELFEVIEDGRMLYLCCNIYNNRS